MVELILTTNPGIEDLVLTELSEHTDAVVASSASHRDRPGVVWARLDLSPAEAAAVAHRMQSIHHARRPLDSFALDADDPLGSVRRRLAGLDIAELTPGRSFRVTGFRSGDHGFTSIDLQKMAGAGVRDRFRHPVSMKQFDVDLRVEVDNDRCDVAVQLTRRALSRRADRPFSPRTALRANVAYAMLRLTLDGQPAPRRLLDPFCGSATLLAEAARRYPDTRLDGVELFPRTAAGARENIAALGLTDRATVHEADGRQLRVLFPHAEGAFDAIVTNPPFGLRLGAKLDFEVFFDGLLTDAAYLLRDGGRIAVLVWHRRAFNRAMRRRHRDLESVHVRVIETGNVYPGLFILSRKPRGD